MKPTQERLEKLTSKIKNSIQNHNIDAFDKWYSYANKELKPHYFRTLFETEGYFLSQKDSEFFAQFISRVHSELEPENWRKIILGILSCNTYKNYDIVKKILGNSMYELPLFKDNIIYKFYSRNFLHDFDNILKMQPQESLKGFCSNIHVNGLMSHHMTNMLFDTLQEEDKKESLVNNLIKSIENNKAEDINFFFKKLFMECNPNEQLQEKILMHCFISYPLYQRQESEKFYGEYRKIRGDTTFYDFLSHSELAYSKGGEEYRKLLGNFLLKEKLDNMPVVSKNIVRNKI